MQAVFEAEITEFLDRGRYQRAGAGGRDRRTGSRNGYREVTVKTAAEPVQLSRPKLRGTTEVFASRLFGLHVTKTNALESLVIASFVRGLSVRYAEAAWPRRSATRPRSPSPRVTAVCGQIKYSTRCGLGAAWTASPLDYLFPDASFFRMHPGSPAGAVVTAWGITTGGKPAFIGLAPGGGESARGLARPSLPRSAARTARRLVAEGAVAVAGCCTRLALVGSRT